MPKLWAFKSELTVPFGNIINAHRNTESVRGWKGWRAPGTSISSIITAGTFYRDGHRIFWDVSNIENCIIVDLEHEEYKQLIIEVDNPTAALLVLNNK
jgi:hypothetical protein